MGTWLPETCREYKETYMKEELCVKLVICKDQLINMHGLDININNYDCTCVISYFRAGVYMNLIFFRMLQYFRKNTTFVGRLPDFSRLYFYQHKC
jgi:hypothetical protein